MKSLRHAKGMLRYLTTVFVEHLLLALVSLGHDDAECRRAVLGKLEESRLRTEDGMAGLSDSKSVNQFPLTLTVTL